VPNFTEGVEKFTGPQLLFRGNLLNSTFKISEQRIFIIVINVRSQDSRLNVSK